MVNFYKFVHQVTTVSFPFHSSSLHYSIWALGQNILEFVVMKIPVVFLAVFLLIGWAEAKKRVPGSLCKRIRPIPFDETWFDEQGKAGFNFPMGSKLEFTHRKVPQPPKKEPKELKTRKCWTMTVKTIFGEVPTSLRCRYNAAKEQTCYMKASGSFVDYFKFYGAFVATKTDNSSYVVGYGCLFGTNEFWIAAVPKGVTLSEETEEDILQHIVSLGLSREEEDLKSEDDPISLSGMKASNCKEKVGKGLFPDIPKVKAADKVKAKVDKEASKATKPKGGDEEESGNGEPEEEQPEE